MGSATTSLLRHSPVLALAWLAGCATVPEPNATAWHCSGKAKVGDVAAWGQYSLFADGTTESTTAWWEWSFRQGKVKATMKSGFAEQDPNRDSEIDISARRSGSHEFWIKALELRVGDDPAPPARKGWRTEQRGYLHLNPSPADLLPLIGAGRPLYVVGLRRDGTEDFRIPIDPGAILRGREAMKLALEGARQESRDFRKACMPASKFEGAVIA